MTTHALCEAFELLSCVNGSSSQHPTFVGNDRLRQVPLHQSVSESVAAIYLAGNGVSSALIKYALDAGARGILAPMVSSAEKAKEVVMDSRFPPAGRRGFGSPFTHRTWGLTAHKVTAMVQIEAEEGVENMKDIVAVDGIDVLFIAPCDLSISIGYPPPSPDPHPSIENVIKETLRVAHFEGKKWLVDVSCVSLHTLI
ncbi:phosphoenolpyruvate pyruvate domain-containing protein [Desarmillaria ectypa]|nr:phosphoenolpyruvate pyruvate domain-containing protein [Desarmillaria ectypa]